METLFLKQHNSSYIFKNIIPEKDKVPYSNLQFNKWSNEI